MPSFSVGAENLNLSPNGWMETTLLIKLKFQPHGDYFSQTQNIACEYFHSHFFLDRFSLCSPSLPGTYAVDQADLELAEVCSPLSPKCW